MTTLYQKETKTMEINLNDEEEIILIIDDTCKFKIWGERNSEGTMILRHDIIKENKQWITTTQ